MALDSHDLSHLKVKDLQRELKKRGLDTSGLKAVLLERLKEHLQQEEAGKYESAEDKDDAKEKGNEEGDKEQQDAVINDADTIGDREGEKSDEPASKSGEKDKEVGEDLANGKTKKTGGDAMDDGPKEADSKGVKRSADELTTEGEDNITDVKKPKLSEEATKSPQRDDDDDNNDGEPESPADAANNDKDTEEAAEASGDCSGNEKTTLRIDNFVRPFTLNAVKALVQEFGDFVKEGFWMDVIKTHCFVTYPDANIAKKTSAALDGKVWPPENGRALRVSFVDQTAMDVSANGESSKASSQAKGKGDDESQATPRPKVTIDEFFMKTEAKPVLYYLPLTDEQVEQKKQRKNQRQEDGQPRKRRNRGGRKRRNRGRFQRR